MPAVGTQLNRNPWWIPRLLFGLAPEVERRKLTLLGCVAIAMFYENYDLSLLNTSLKHIAESLRVEETNLGYFVASIRFAGLFGLLLIPAADLIGRRRLFLISVIGMSLGTALTGVSQSPEQFVLLQMATRGFMITACAMAVVILVEEFPAEHRGWAIGMLGTASVVGHGAGTLLFACIDAMPFGWRTLYLLGFIPIIRLPMFRRGIYEPERFQRYQRDDLGNRSLGYSFTSWLRPYGRGCHVGLRWLRRRVQLHWIFCACLSRIGTLAICRPVNPLRFLIHTGSKLQWSYVRSLWQATGWLFLTDYFRRLHLGLFPGYRMGNVCSCCTHDVLGDLWIRRNHGPFIGTVPHPIARNIVGIGNAPGSHWFGYRPVVGGRLDRGSG